MIKILEILFPVNSKNYKFYFTMRKPYDTTPIKWLFHLDCSCKHFYFYNEENEAKFHYDLRMEVGGCVPEFFLK